MNSATSEAEAIPHRLLGVSGAELFDVTVREVEKTLRQAGGSRLRAVKIALKRLHSAGALTKRDLKRVDKAYELMFLVAGGKRSREEVTPALSALHGETLLDAEASKLAVTIMGVIYSRATEAEIIAAGGLIGGAIGAAIGFAVGGGEGAGIGFVIGMVAGAFIAGQCFADEADRRRE